MLWNPLRSVESMICQVSCCRRAHEPEMSQGVAFRRFIGALRSSRAIALSRKWIARVEMQDWWAVGSVNNIQHIRQWFPSHRKEAQADLSSTNFLHDHVPYS